MTVRQTTFDLVMQDNSKDAVGLYDDGWGLQKIGNRSAYLMSINDTFMELVFKEFRELITHSLIDFELVFSSPFLLSDDGEFQFEEVYWSKSRGILLYLQSDVLSPQDSTSTLSARVIFEVKSKIDPSYTMEMQLDDLDNVPCWPEMWSDSVAKDGHYYKKLFTNGREGLITRIARLDLHPRLSFNPDWVVAPDVDVFVRLLNVREDKEVGLGGKKYTAAQTKKIEKLARKKIEQFKGGCYEWLMGGE